MLHKLSENITAINQQFSLINIFHSFFCPLRYFWLSSLVSPSPPPPLTLTEQSYQLVFSSVVSTSTEH